MPKTLEKNNKQVYFKHDADTRIVARTPVDSGLTLTMLIAALVEVQERVGVTKSDNLTPIFEDENGDVSWTIQQVAFDKSWVRLS